MKKLLAVVLSLGVLVPAAMAADVAAGKTKSAACAGCHGPQGNSPANPLWPKLAGQHADYVASQLKHFKTGTGKMRP